MRRLAIWALAGIASIAFTVLAFFPAAWIAAWVDAQSAGRLTLGDAQGTLWHGSAFIGGASGNNEPVTPLLPGRFAWRLSPLALVGVIDAELENTASLSQPVMLTGGWYNWQVSPAAILLPAERLAALGAPLNTIQPSGQMRLSWGPMQLEQQDGAIGINGSVTLEMNDIASRMSPIRPLGSYNLALDWRGLQAAVTLSTTKGPLQLSGSGTLDNGQLNFSGKAEAEAGQEEKLANLLNLLGQRRREGGKDIIALEFK